jgi:multidrug efflux pump subunit AcrB
MMNMNQIMYDLTYWFDFVLLAVSHHPLISVATVLVAFLFYQALGVMKVIGTIISFGLAVATAILLQMLM